MSNFNQFILDIEKLDDELRDLRSQVFGKAFEKKQILREALNDDEFLHIAIQMNAVTLNVRALRRGHSTKPMPKAHVK